LGNLLDIGNKSPDKKWNNSSVKVLLTQNTEHMFIMMIVADTTLIFEPGYTGSGGFRVQTIQFIFNVKIFLILHMRETFSNGLFMQCIRSAQCLQHLTFKLMEFVQKGWGMSSAVGVDMFG
jgi:hypothetical protein